ncbi:MAG: hypothetical protein COA79_19265 [Planctomycetota bacterium]|nr:MAG: hypothetical protein COA79_19265 [Planctomycetota bacterium]
MNNQQYKPHPLNSKGDFIVVDGGCISCNAPVTEAPGLMCFDSEGQCYFKKQPSNEKELQDAVTAINISCCGAVMYVGNDKQILLDTESATPFEMEFEEEDLNVNKVELDEETLSLKILPKLISFKGVTLGAASQEQLLTSKRNCIIRSLVFVIMISNCVHLILKGDTSVFFYYSSYIGVFILMLLLIVQITMFTCIKKRLHNWES